MTNIVIFTDLDGTLLDYSNYSFEKALPAIEFIKLRTIPLILCSSKTRTEIEYYRRKLANHHPFISENGGGIFIPKHYFDTPIPAGLYNIEEEADYDVIRLGARYTDLRRVIEELREKGYEITGFGDMTIEELAASANMSIDEATMAKERDFDEPFVYKGPGHKLCSLFGAISEKGFKFTRGRFFHIMGSTDKGLAVSILIDLYKLKHGNVRTIGAGDAPNDIPMLERVDYPVVVQKRDGTYESQIDIPKLIKAEGIGPEGWNKVILELLRREPD